MYNNATSFCSVLRYLYVISKTFYCFFFKFLLYSVFKFKTLIETVNCIFYHIRIKIIVVKESVLHFFTFLHVQNPDKIWY